MQFITVPNQRVVTIHKPAHKKGDFTTVGITVMLNAMQELSYSGFMLYCYFMLNADGFEQIISPAYILKNTALTKNTYHKAFHELESKGYLVQSANAKTLFDFYEIPKSGTPYTKKQDDAYQNSVENINKQKDKTDAQAPSRDALGSAHMNGDKIKFYDF